MNTRAAFAQLSLDGSGLFQAGEHRLLEQEGAPRGGIGQQGLHLLAALGAGIGPAVAHQPRVLDGLGAVGGGAHAANEWVSLSTIEERSAFLHAFIKELLA